VFLKFQRPEVHEKEIDGDHSMCKIIREVQALRKFSSNNSK
jgi:hypothetical protein